MAPPSTGTPPTPSTSNYYQHHRLGGTRPQALGRLVRQNHWRPTRHWLDPIEIRAYNEGSLLLMVLGSLDAERSHRGDEEKVEHKRAGKVSGGVSGRFAIRESGGN